MKLTKANSKAIKYACKNFHYSQSVPTTQYAYNVYNNKDEWCGVILFGGGANNNLAKSFNLRISIALRLLHKENPIVKVVVSYADHRQKHLGIIYQATNWIYLGMIKTSDFQYFYNGKWTHERTINSKSNKDELKATLQKRQNSNKFKYVYCFDKELKEKYNSIKKQYPSKQDLTDKDA